MTEPMTCVQLWLPGRPLSLNDVNRLARSARVQRILARRHYGAMLTAVGAARIARGAQADGAREVTFVRMMGRGERAFDDDDLIGGLKALRDFLGRGSPSWPGLGLIIDDSPRWARFAYAQARAADGKPAVVITITPLPPREAAGAIDTTATERLRSTRRSR